MMLSLTKITLLLLGCNSCKCLFRASAFSAGFSRKPTKRKTPKGKRKRGLDIPPSFSSPAKKPKEKKLDRWGLPVVPSENEVFPPLAQGTELVPVDANHEYSLDDIEQFMTEYADLSLDNCFDVNGIEKNTDDGLSMKLNLLHCSPPVLEIENFLNTEQCEEVKESIDKGHKVSSATFQGAISTRTSTSWFCNFSDVPLLLAKANFCLGIPLETMEEPQIVRYHQGEEFSWHYDEVPPSQLKNGGQRVATILVYLNDVATRCGGGTMFRDLKAGSSSTLTMQPKMGSALIFFPSDKHGRPDDRTLHRSEIMSCDTEKWIIQMWVHERSYEATLPIGNSNEKARTTMENAIKKLRFR